GRTVADIGTGAGAVGLLLQKQWHKSRVVLTDVSSGALEMAGKNAEALGVSPEIFRGSLFEPLTDRGIMADCIVSNPPYIAYDEKDEMDASVYRHETNLARFSDDVGWVLYNKMVD